MAASETHNARICRRCGAEPSTVLDTRIRAGDIVARRRECPECGYRWTTVEIDQSLYRELKKKWDGDHGRPTR